MCKISRFAKKAVQLAKNAIGERGEVAEYAVCRCTVCGFTWKILPGGT
jgi:DNA-directed RNA polymerase subunit M/transcription elongation factor TFIIS